MRLRITRQLRESIDGIQMSAFRQGYVYEVGTTIGSYLLAMGAAEPVADDHPYIVLPPEKHLFYPGPSAAAARSAKHDQRSSSDRLAFAADWPLRRRASRKKKRTSKAAHAFRRTASRPADIRRRVAVLAAELERIKRNLKGLWRAI